MSFGYRVHSSKNPAPGLDHAAHVKPDQLPRRHEEQLIDLLERLVLGLGHEEQLVEESEHCQAAEEPNRQTGVGHGRLHAVEVIGDDEGPEIEEGRADGHALAAGVEVEALCRDNPCQAGVSAEEAHVEDHSGEEKAQGRVLVGFEVGVALVCIEIAHAHKDQTHDEDEDVLGPDTTTESVHREHGRDGAEEQRATTDHGHEHRVAVAEVHLGHQVRHVIHDGVDSGHLAEEDHGRGVDEGATVALMRAHLQVALVPGHILRPFDLVLNRDLHGEVLFQVLGVGHVAQRLPHLPCTSMLAFGHEPARRLGQEAHTSPQDGREQDGRAQHPSPAARGDIEEHAAGSIPDDLAQRDHQLIDGHQITTHLRRNAFRNVDTDAASLDPDTDAQNEAAGKQHAHGPGSGAEPASQRVPHARDDDRVATAEVVVQRHHHECASHRAERHQRRDKRDIVGQLWIVHALPFPCADEMLSDTRQSTRNHRLVQTAQHTTECRECTQGYDQRPRGLQTGRDPGKGHAVVQGFILHILLTLLVLHFNLVFQLGRRKGDILGVLDVLVVGVRRFTHIGCIQEERNKKNKRRELHTPERKKKGEKKSTEKTPTALFYTSPDLRFSDPAMFPSGCNSTANFRACGPESVRCQRRDGMQRLQSRPVTPIRRASLPEHVLREEMTVPGKEPVLLRVKKIPSAARAKSENVERNANANVRRSGGWMLPKPSGSYHRPGSKDRITARILPSKLSELSHRESECVELHDGQTARAFHFPGSPGSPGPQIPGY